MAGKTIISCAVTGNQTTRAQHPGLPVTPQEIAQAAIDARKAGAAIAHIHVRDPETGKGSMRIELYREVMERIRDSGSDVLINLTTGEGGRFEPSEDEPRVAGPSTTLTHPLKRVEHIAQLKPDICSLDFNTMNSRSTIVVNTPANLRKMAQVIVAAGVKPELEVFDSGDIHLAKALIEEGLLPGKPFFQVVTGVKWGCDASVETLAYMKSLLPREAIWSAFGIGRMEFPQVALAHLLGGNVRVGMEDNIYIRHGRLVRDNAELVEQAVTLLDIFGAEPATPAEARAMLEI
ncbi:3-keto-5-aminohexanoate cleavage protein [Sphingobium nicotianae]|uniref:3-keto-5-aminohexanoate cleavage protein n=1 Tax=Sphingobium nicotianae TaxID=2782607 RepID=A0A9X1AIH2_9SPHN|nr:3-keto-5-aminohexanoate cleavage protein [Sphingobium nicotianae]MBT2185937.1 3-keto-5-aminohexanoate cleavage protein [Sphingobium nicotianae]